MKATTTRTKKARNSADQIPLAFAMAGSKFFGYELLEHFATRTREAEKLLAGLLTPHKIMSAHVNLGWPAGELQERLMKRTITQWGKSRDVDGKLDDAAYKVCESAIFAGVLAGWRLREMMSEGGAR